MSKLWRWPLAFVLMIPVVVIVIFCIWLGGMLSIAWFVRHPVRGHEDGYNEKISDWVVSKPDDYWLWVAAGRYEALVRKLLKM